MDILDMLKKVLDRRLKESLTDDEIEKQWIQVAKLSDEDAARRRSINAATIEAQREFEMLKKKADAIKARVDAESDEWWFDLHKDYGLPQGNYHIHEDGRVFKEPKETEEK